MKPIALVGLLLIALGLAALVYQGVSYSSRETVLDLGPIHATAEREKTIPLPPVMGITAVVAGVALLVVGARKGK
jgi:multisubunit Na+/H+ antiporter MnhC subunit